MRGRRALVLPAFFALLAAGAVGCSGSSSGDSGGPAVPDGARDLVAMREVSGGFVPMGYDQATLPDVAVYGDGWVYAGTDDGRLYRLEIGRDGVTAFVGELAGTGLADLPEQVEPEGGLGFADVPSTYLSVWRDGGLHRVGASGLDVPEAQYPASLRAADGLLVDLGHRTVREGDEWDPDRLRLVAVGVPAPTDAVDEWPDAVPVPDALGAVSADTVTVADVTDAATTAALLDAFAGRRPVNLRLPNGPVTLLWRPLLPNE
jgi:hypothetical protein